MNVGDIEQTTAQLRDTWQPVKKVFDQWIKDKQKYLVRGLTPEPTIKVLIFLALLEAEKECTYDDIREIFKIKNVIQGIVPDNTLRTSVSNLGKTLDKYNHHLELQSFRGRFQLTKRLQKTLSNYQTETNCHDVILLTDPPALTAEKIAETLIQKSMLPFCALYFLEWSARWWENYSSVEAEKRRQYEANAWEKLGIKNRLSNSNNSLISFIGLAPGEGIAEIELLKKILREDPNIKIHYVAVDSSQRLLRDHMGLLKETLTQEIENGQLICAGVIADIFNGLSEAVMRVKRALLYQGSIHAESDFLPIDSGMLVTYLGNCLGNNIPDQEMEIFSNLHSTFQNRPLEFLVGVSLIRETPDEYKRIWDDFLLQTPRHLLETKKLLKSHKSSDQNDLPEFILPKDQDENNRCPPVLPEPYIVRHQIKGQIYRFYYRLAYDLSLSNYFDHDMRRLPKGTLILIYNIIKYNIKTLVEGIEKGGLFKVIYDKNYHQIINTSNGKREYAVFSAYLEK